MNGSSAPPSAIRRGSPPGNSTTTGCARSTGQHADVWDTCHRLADAVKRWRGDLDAIVYRSRTTPQTSVNFAFFTNDAFEVQSWALADRTDSRTDLVPDNGFTIGWDYRLSFTGRKSGRRYSIPLSATRSTTFSLH